MKSTIRIQSILDRYPDVEQILSMYDVEINDSVSVMTIEELCETFDIDMEDLLMDIEEAIEDSRQAEWLANGHEEDQWTENFTEEYDGSSSNNDNDNDDAYDDSDENFDDEF